MTFSDYREPSGPLYPQLGIIQLHQRIEILNVLFVNASLKKMVPSSLQNMFVFSRCHNHGLRNQLRLSMMNVRTTRYGLNSIKSKCIKAWNKFSNEGLISINDWPMSNNRLRDRLKSHFLGRR